MHIANNTAYHIVGECITNYPSKYASFGKTFDLIFFVCVCFQEWYPGEKDAPKRTDPVCTLE
jgi:hypothetical protein